jgi:type IV pilus assembly protein PilC
MPIFEYTARTESGQLVSETVAFNNEVALRDYLRENNLFVVGVEERRRVSLQVRRRAGLGDLIIMTRQLRTMINAGMPLVTGLQSLAQVTPNRHLAEVLEQIGRSVGHGTALAAALEQYPHVFPQMLVALVRAGEEGGRLPETLKEAARQLELQMEIRQKVITAMIYPAFTLLATFGAVVFMLLWIVPVFSDIYEELKAPLPPITLSVVWASDLLLSYGWVVLVVVAGVVIALRRYNATPGGRLRLDGLRLKLPVFGSLMLKSSTANLTGSLAGLVDSGVPLIRALETAAGACGNAVIEQAVLQASRNIVLGRRLSDELEQTGLFPLMVTRMIAVSEDVGTLPMVLREIADSYIEEVDYTLRRLMSMMEPMMIAVIGVVVGYILLAIYYPIFNIGRVFEQGA